MPRKPDERIIQAKELYLKGLKLVEIASQLSLPEGTVRRWKWDNERSDKNSERSLYSCLFLHYGFSSVAPAQ